MARAAFEDILRHQNETKYDPYRYNGRLNVAECLENSGISPQNGFYSVVGSRFPEVDYSKLDFFDIQFKDCRFPNARFSGAVFDGCELSPSPNNLDGVHLLHMLVLDSGHSRSSFVGARLTNCTSHGFSGGNFTNALIESDGKSLGQFFNMGAADPGFQDCIFDGVVIKQQYIHARLVASLRNTTLEDSVLFNTGIFGEISHSYFRNVTVEFPNWVFGGELVDRRTLIDLQKFKNNTISHCNWEYTTFSLPESPTGFLGNSFVDNSFACSGIFGNSGNYAGDKLKLAFESQSQGALMQNNNYEADRFVFYPCIKYSNINLFLKIAITVGVCAVALLVLGVLYAGSAKVNKVVERRRLLADFRSLTDRVQYLQKNNLKNTLNFQAGTIKFLRNLLYIYYKEHGYIIPRDLIGTLLNNYPTIDLSNPDLLFYAEIKAQREELMSEFSFSRIVNLQDNLEEAPPQVLTFGSRVHRWAQSVPIVRSMPFFSSTRTNHDDDQNELAELLLPMPSAINPS